MSHDLASYVEGAPPEFVDYKGAKQVVFPDLHGNALAAIYRLEAHGILKLDKYQRCELARIYLKSENLIPQDVTEFSRILNSVIIDKDKFERVLFIGDVLGDRGKNDVLTL